MSEINLHENIKAKMQKDDVLKRNTKKKTRFLKNQLDKDSSGYIVEYEGNKLTVDYLYSRTNEQKEIIAKYLFDHFRSKGFPYPKFSERELREDYFKLCDFNSQNVLSKENIISSASNHGSKIFKHFNRHFWNACDKESNSAIEVFNDDKKLIRVIRNRIGLDFYYRGVSYPFDISENMIRQGMRSMRLVPHTTNFRATIAKFFYDRYCSDGDIVYDYSSGFNQRLLGASSCSKKISYIGVDPWKETIDAGNEIIKFFDFKNVKLILSQSEIFCPEELKGKISLAFSSPPYYDKEIYSSDKTQAYSGRSYDDFLKEYWLKTILNVRSLLNEKGLFIINICDKQENKNIKEDMENKITENGFEKIEEYKLALIKSHLSNKVGTENTMKYESIDVFRNK